MESVAKGIRSLFLTDIIAAQPAGGNRCDAILSFAMVWISAVYIVSGYSYWTIDFEVTTKLSRVKRFQDPSS